MKKTLLKSSLVLALASLGFTTSAHAVISAAGNDLFMGFRAGGGVGQNDNYLINLGAVEFYRDKYAGVGTGFITIGNIDTDLKNKFGNSWSTRSDVYWGVAGTNGSTTGTSTTFQTLYASQAETIFGTKSSGFLRAGQGTQTAPAGMIGDLGSGYLNFGLEGIVTLTATGNVNPLSSGFETKGAGNNAWADFLNGTVAGGDFGYFNPTIEGSFANGADLSALDLWRAVPTGTSNQPAIYEGTFTLSSNGDLFFRQQPVPEASSTLLISMALGAVGLRRRRK